MQITRGWCGYTGWKASDGRTGINTNASNNSSRANVCNGRVCQDFEICCPKCKGTDARRLGVYKQQGEDHCKKVRAEHFNFIIPRRDILEIILIVPFLLGLGLKIFTNEPTVRLGDCCTRAITSMA